jgi:hypothetical protein
MEPYLCSLYNNQAKSYSRKIQHNNQIEIDYRSFDEKENVSMPIQLEVFEKNNIQ